MNKISIGFKKILALALMFSVIVQIGCKEEKNEIEHTETANLFYNLQEFNKQYFRNNIKQIKLKSSQKFWSSIADALVVSGADLIGAAAGAVAVKDLAAVAGLATGGTGAAVVISAGAIIAGGGASVTAYRELKSANMPKRFSELYLGNLNIKYPQKYIDYKDCGLNHNKEVYAIMNDIPDSRHLKSAELNDTTKAGFKSPEWQQMICHIEESVLEYKVDKNAAELARSFEEKSLISDNMSKVLLLFNDIFEHVKCEKHVEDIINYYMNSVSNAQCLREKEKVALICSFSVASESLILWLNQYQNEKTD